MQAAICISPNLKEIRLCILQAFLDRDRKTLPNRNRAQTGEHNLCLAIRYSTEGTPAPEPVQAIFTWGFGAQSKFLANIILGDGSAVVVRVYWLSHASAAHILASLIANPEPISLLMISRFSGKVKTSKMNFTLVKAMVVFLKLCWFSQPEMEKQRSPLV
jgi:hypothetical protein